MDPKEKNDDNALGMKEDDKDIDEKKTSMDLLYLGWTSFGWLRHKNKSRILVVILLLNIIMITYFIFTTYTKGESSHNKRILIALTTIDVLLVVLLFKYVGKHATLPFTSLDKVENRFTGRASLKRLLDALKNQVQEEIVNNATNEENARIKELKRRIAELEVQLAESKKTQCVMNPSIDSI